MVILGVDPGSVRTGYGAIDTDGRCHRLLEKGAIAPPPRFSLHERLRLIHLGVAELIARIHALLRRAGKSSDSAPLSLGEVAIDLAARKARHPDREEELTPIETDLLRYLLARRGQAVDRHEMLKDLWGLDPTYTTRTLDNHMARLRRKIERDPQRPRFLVTVHRVGYRLEEETTS